MRKGYCLFEGPGAGVGKVVAVHDSFGSTFRVFNQPHDAGEILTTHFHCDGSERATRPDEGQADLNVKILGRVHANTVRATLRRIGREHLQLRSGYWHEVHGD